MRAIRAPVRSADSGHGTGLEYPSIEVGEPRKFRASGHREGTCCHDDEPSEVSQSLVGFNAPAGTFLIKDGLGHPCQQLNVTTKVKAVSDVVQVAF